VFYLKISEILLSYVFLFRYYFFTFSKGILDSNINIQWNSPLGLVIFQHTRTNCQNSPIFGLFVGYG